MRRAFTLIELLVIVAILATMVTIGVGSIMSGQGAAKVKGATRDVYAAIRQARSTALVTGQRVLVNYSNESVDEEPTLKIDIVAAKIMSADSGGVKPQPYNVMDYKELPTPVVRTDSSPIGAEGPVGETLEEILFSPMDTKVVKGMRIKVLKGEDALQDETAEQTRSRISVFSNVDYLRGRYEAAKKESEDKDEAAGGKETSGSINDMDESVSVVWETNGAVEPHRIWIYPDGRKPEDGLMLNVDMFGAIKVVGGDGREED